MEEIQEYPEQPNMRSIGEGNAEEFSVVRNLLLSATDYVEFRAPYMPEDVVDSYMRARQELRDMPDEMMKRMTKLGHEFVTRNWILEQAIKIISSKGIECPKEFYSVKLY